MAKKKKPKSKTLDGTLKDISQLYGDNAVYKYGDREPEDVPAISTMSYALDEAIGVGGLPRGRIVEIYGPESSGKTTLCLHVIARAQKLGGKVAFIDMEHALDISYAKKLNVNVKEMFFSQPDYGEMALEIADRLVTSGKFDVIIIDSVAALVPKAEIEGEMGDATMGSQARLMSQACRKMSGKVKKTNTLVIFTNQLRKKIGVMFGNPETTAGGNALKFYASVRLDIRVKKKEADFNHVKVKVVKNKVGVPFKQVEFDIRFGVGIDWASELLDLAIEANLIEKKGAWFYLSNVKAGSRKKMISKIRKSEKIQNYIKKKLHKQGE